MINILIQNDISTLQANSESGESMYHTNVGRKLKGGGGGVIAYIMSVCKKKVVEGLSPSPHPRDCVHVLLFVC